MRARILTNSKNINLDNRFTALNIQDKEYQVYISKYTESYIEFIPSFDLKLNKGEQYELGNSLSPICKIEII